MTKLHLLNLLILFCPTTFAQEWNILGGSDRLVDPYGICAHISMSDIDVSLREKEMQLAEELGVSYVRSDFIYGQIYDKSGNANMARLDSAVACARRHGIKFLPILGRNTRRGYAWEDKNEYLRYVTTLSDHFGEVKNWEVINEPDLIKGQGSKSQLAEKYMTIVPEVCDILHRHKKKALLGGLASIEKEFFGPVVKNGVMEHCDIMNFHFYSSHNTPETAIRYYATVRDSLTRHGGLRPVWVTETGYHTEPHKSVARQFATDVLRELMEREGIGQGSTVGVVADEEWAFSTVSEQMTDELEQMGYTISWLRLTDLKGLDPRKVKMLVPTQGESFPMAYFDDLEDYVRRGGTLLLSQGIPFYYDYTNQGKTKSVGHEYRTRLHIATDLPWDNTSRGKGVPNKPSKYGTTQHIKSHYAWQPEGDQTTRYMCDNALRKGDRLISAVEAGNERYTGSIAGVYELRSDLRGNIIFNTSFGRYANISERLQAKRLTRSYLVAFASGVEKMFWYNLRASESKDDDKECHFGIVHKDLSPKPAFYAYKTLTRMLPSLSTRPEMTKDSRSGVYRCEWTRPDGKHVLAVWTTAHKTTIEVPRRYRRGRVTDYMGNSLGRASRTITIDNGVTYIVVQ